MSRRGVVNVLLYVCLALLLVGSALAAVATYTDYAAVALEPDRAFGGPWAVTDAVIVDNQAFWPSVTVTGEVAPGVRDTATVTAAWWLVSPLLVAVIAVLVVAWRRGARELPELAGDDTQPIPVAH